MDDRAGYEASERITLVITVIILCRIDFDCVVMCYKTARNRGCYVPNDPVGLFHDIAMHHYIHGTHAHSYTNYRIPSQYNDD